MPGMLVPDEMDCGKTFTSVAVAIICEWLMEKVVMALLLRILGVNILEGLVNMARNDHCGIIGEEWEWYPL